DAASRWRHSRTRRSSKLPMPGAPRRVEIGDRALCGPNASLSTALASSDLRCRVSVAPLSNAKVIKVAHARGAKKGGDRRPSFVRTKCVAVHRIGILRSEMPRLGGATLEREGHQSCPCQGRQEGWRSETELCADQMRRCPPHWHPPI